MTWRALSVGVLLAAGLALAGCAPRAWPDQPVVQPPAPVWLSQTESVGQSVLALEAGLAGADVFLGPAEAAGPAEIHLRLRAGPAATEDLAVARLPLSAISSPGFHRFNFETQPGSRQRDYYLLLELAGPGRVQVGTGPPEAYAQGALYQGGEPAEAQLVFRLVYAAGPLWRGALGDTARYGFWLLLAAVGYLLPGWALLAWLWPGAGGLGWPARLGLAAGLSLALYPVLFLWTDLFGLRLGAAYLWLPVATGAVAFLALAWARQTGRLPAAPVAAPAAALRLRLAAWARSDCLWPDLAYLGLALLTAATRFWPARNIEVPLFGDSVQHTMIAQLLVDHGGLFESWQPLASLTTFTYHFGFHTAVAVFHWLTGLSLPQATLWTGQLLNLLAALALYPLAQFAADHVPGAASVRPGATGRWAGAAAVLVAGLLAPLPMAYTNWGRYTQLAGQVILPAVAVLSWAWLAAPRRDGRLLALAALAFGGLALTHYRVLVIAVLFVAAAWLLTAADGRAWSGAGRLALLGLMGGALFLPWFVGVFGGRLMLVLAAQLTTAPSSGSVWAEVNALPQTSLYPPGFWLLLALSLAAGLWRQSRGAALVGLWWLLVVLAANPQWFGLPGQAALSNFTVLVAAYVPAALLTGVAVAEGLRGRRWVPRGAVRRAPAFVLLVGLFTAGLWGGRQRLSDLQPAVFALATRPDLRAAAWIKANLPPDARLLVNSFRAFGGYVTVGSDGGWWLPQLAQRQTTLPPINYTSELADRPDYIEWVNAVPTALEQSGPASPQFLALLAERGVTHVYIGQAQGRVNYTGPDILRPADLLASPAFRPVYHQDRVWIFEVVP